MQIANVHTLPEEHWTSPQGRFGCGDRHVSLALGRDEKSTDLLRRHPFDVEICRIPPGKAMCPYHAHSAQWEFYHVLAGRGSVRHADGVTPVGPGDAFLFRPGEPHQLTNDGPDDWVLMIVADNPLGESVHYPDSGKWLVQSPGRRLLRSGELGYFDGEEPGGGEWREVPAK